VEMRLDRFSRPFHVASLPVSVKKVKVSRGQELIGERPVTLEVEVVTRGRR
jgi:hypothetical protein